MTRQFTIDATPTGFFDGRVILTGEFHWNFDLAGEMLVNYEARNISLSRDQFLAGTGVLYRFSHEIQDGSDRGVVETVVAGSKGLRDTVNLTVRLIAKHNDGAGMVNEVLGTAELREAGARYFQPPLG